MNGEKLALKLHLPRPKTERRRLCLHRATITYVGLVFVSATSLAWSLSNSKWLASIDNYLFDTPGVVWALGLMIVTLGVLGYLWFTVTSQDATRGQSTQKDRANEGEEEALNVPARRDATLAAILGLLSVFSFPIAAPLGLTAIWLGVLGHKRGAGWEGWVGPVFAVVGILAAVFRPAGG